MSAKPAAPTPACKPGPTSQPTNFTPGSSSEGEYPLVATNVSAKATEGEITITDTLPVGFGVACTEDQSARKGGGSMKIEAEGEVELETKRGRRGRARLRFQLTCSTLLGAGALYGLLFIIPNRPIYIEMASKCHLVGKQTTASCSQGKDQRRVSLDLGEAEISVTSDAPFSLRATPGLACSDRGPVRFCNLSIEIHSGSEEGCSDREPRR